MLQDLEQRMLEVWGRVPPLRPHGLQGDEEQLRLAAEVRVLRWSSGGRTEFSLMAGGGGGRGVRGGGPPPV